MTTYTLVDRAFIVETFFIVNGCSSKYDHEKLCEKLICITNNHPSETTVKRLVKHFRETGSLEEDRETINGDHPPTASSIKNVAYTYPLVDRAFIIETFFVNGCSLKKSHRKIGEKFGVNNCPSESTIQRLVKKFRETGSLEDHKRTGRPLTALSSKNIAIVRDSLQDKPSTSIRHRSRQLGISSSSLWRILHNERIFDSESEDNDKSELLSTDNKIDDNPIGGMRKRKARKK